MPRIQTPKSNKKRTKSPATKGWKKMSPKKGKQRHELKQKCGSKAFLLPNEEKFPVMTSDCKFSLAGLQSAYIRAEQWGYPEVAAKAKHLINQQQQKKKK